MNLEELVARFGHNEDHDEWERIVAHCMAMLQSDTDGLHTSFYPLTIKKPQPIHLDFMVVAPPGLPDTWYASCHSVVGTILHFLSVEASLVPTLSLCIPTNVTTRPEWGLRSVLCVMLCRRDDEFFAFQSVAVPHESELAEAVQSLVDGEAEANVMEIRFDRSPYSGPSLKPLEILFTKKGHHRSPSDPCMN